MPYPIEEICEKLNAISEPIELPQVYANISPQGSTLPYIVVSELNPQIERYFGGVVQIVDFQIKQYYNKYSLATVMDAKNHQELIKLELDGKELPTEEDKCRIMHRIAPYRLNPEDDNNFSLTQTWKLYYEE